MATQPEGHHSPGTQPGQGAGQQPGQQQPYEPIEKKHLADEATGRKEPSAHPERPAPHQPGYEAKHQKEAGKERQRDEGQTQRSQGDDVKARNDANDEIDATHTQKANRTTRSSASKQHVRRALPAKKAKKPVRKHK